MWLVNLAIYVVLIAFTLIVGAVAGIIAGISWLVNWFKTRDKPVPQAHYSDRR
jgi:hypothetical protein